MNKVFFGTAAIALGLMSTTAFAQLGGAVGGVGSAGGSLGSSIGSVGSNVGAAGSLGTSSTVD
ncbi:MAG: hypothetical protein EOP61_27175, partial [Sphingomonadales bacterium]